MTFEQILGHFRGVRRKDTSAMAQCPAHEDKNPSLSIGIGDNGRILVYCFAGCKPQAIVEALGLTIADLFPKPLENRDYRLENATVRALATYKHIPESFLRELGLKDAGGGVWIPYRNVDGQLVRHRVRYSLSSKESRWEASENSLCLYGLSRLSEMSKHKYLVCVEGESDAWTLWLHDIPALGFPGASTYNLIEKSHLANLHRIYVVREPDEGGDKFLLGLRKRLAELDFQGKILETRMPDRIKDPNELFRCAPEDFARHFDNCLKAGTCSAGNIEQDHQRWDVPVPFEDIELPSFPLEALPSVLAQSVRTVAEATQTPLDLAAVLAIVLVGAACAKKFRIEVREGYTEPTNLFALVVLSPANRKSAVFRHVMAPFNSFEQREMKRTGPLRAAEAERLRIKEEALKKLREQAAEVAASPELLEKAEALAQEIDATRVPQPLRLIVDDCTPERLASLLQDNGGRIAIMSAEGDAIDIIAGRYSPDRNPRLGIYLKGHSGDDHRVERTSRDREYIEAPAITIGLTVQPSVAQGLGERPAFRDRGLLGRFLYSWPQSLLGRRNVRSARIAPEIERLYVEMIERLLEKPLAAEPTMLHLSEEAKSVLLKFEEWIEPQLHEYGALGYMSDWAGKLTGAVARLSAILHLAAAASDAAWDTRFEIQASTVRGAIKIALYLIPHARKAYAEMGAEPLVSNAKYLLGWIASHRMTVFQKREIHQATRHRFARVQQLEPVLVALIERNYIRERFTDPDSRPGRKPSPWFEVNPLWIAQNTQNAQNGVCGNGFEDSEYFEEALRVAAGTPASGDDLPKSFHSPSSDSVVQ